MEAIPSPCWSLLEALATRVSTNPSEASEMDLPTKKPSSWRFSVGSWPEGSERALASRPSYKSVPRERLPCENCGGKDKGLHADSSHKKALLARGCNRLMKQRSRRCYDEPSLVPHWGPGCWEQLHMTIALPFKVDVLKKVTYDYCITVQSS